MGDTLTGTRKIGRPPKRPEDRAGPQIQFRIRGGYMLRLREAAVRNGRSISEEAEFRLNRSFDLDDIREAIRQEFADERARTVEKQWSDLTREERLERLSRPMTPYMA